MASASLSEQELQELARATLSGYMSYVHRTDSPHLWDGQAVPAEHHKEMIAALKNDEVGNTLIVMPRGSGKTTLVQYWLEWKLGLASISGDKDWPNTWRAVFFSNSAHQAYRISNAIKATLESNTAFQALFPKVKPHKDKWSQEEWKVKGNTIKDANFVAIGVGGPALGARALYMVFDDVADQENMKTQYMRTDLREWLNNTAMPILVPWGRAVMTCTRWHWEDPAAWAKDRGWTHLFKRALEEDGGEHTSYWPDRFSVEWLLHEKAADSKSFARQYQNQVVPDEGLVFQRWWFRAYDQLPTEVLWKVQSWDTAAGLGRNRSYSAGWEAMVTPDFHIYLRDLRHGQYPWGQLKTVAKTYAQISKPDAIIIENASSGMQLIEELREDPDIAPRIFDWLPAGSGQKRGDKEALVAAAAEFCAQGRVHFPAEPYAKSHGQGWLDTAESELFAYPDGQNDDIVDSLCQMIFWVREQERRMRNRPEPEALSWGRSTERAVRV